MCRWRCRGCGRGGETQTFVLSGFEFTMMEFCDIDGAEEIGNVGEKVRDTDAVFPVFLTYAL